MKRLALVAALAATSLALAACNANPSTGGSSPSASSGPVAKGGTLTILTSATVIDLDPAKSQNLAITTLGLVRAPPHHLGHPARQAGEGGPRPRDRHRQAERRRQDLDLHAEGRPEVLRRHRRSPARTSSTASSARSPPSSPAASATTRPCWSAATPTRVPTTASELSSIETPDDHTIVFHLNSAVRRLAVDRLDAGLHAGAQGSRQARRRTATTRSPAGPYQVKSNKQGNALVLERNPNWGQDRPGPHRRPGLDRVQARPGHRRSGAAADLPTPVTTRTRSAPTFVPPAQLAQIQQNAVAKQRLATSDPGALAVPGDEHPARRAEEPQGAAGDRVRRRQEVLPARRPAARSPAASPPR